MHSPLTRILDTGGDVGWPRRHARQGYLSSAFSRLDLVGIIAILLLLIALGIPALSRMRREARSEKCAKNLKDIGIAFRVWALDASAWPPTRYPTNAGGTRELISSGLTYVHFRPMSNEIIEVQRLICPLDNEKKPATNFSVGFTDANVSYFVSVDAQETFPWMFQAGDRNVSSNGFELKPGLFVLSNGIALGWSAKLHNDCGNVLLADGSVSLLVSRMLDKSVRDQGCETNRLVIP